MKNQLFTIFGAVLALASTHHQLYAQCWTQVGNNLDGVQQYENAGNFTCLSADGLTVAYGAQQYNANQGRVQIFSWNGGSWIQKGSDITGISSGERHGSAVDMSADGNLIAVGVQLNSEVETTGGAFRVYEWDGNTWQQKGSTIYGDLSGQALGKSIDISDDGKTVAVGAPFRSIDANTWTTIGLTRVYRWDEGTADWIKIGQDLIGFEDGDWFGKSLSLTADGNTLAVGANFSNHFNTSGGYVTVYQWNGTEWETDFTFEGNTNYTLGNDVDLTPDGTTIAIGCTSASISGSNSGTVRVYNVESGSWAFQGTIPGETAGCQYGQSVAISEDGLIITASGMTSANSAPWSQRGYMNTHFWNGSNWEKIGDDIEGTTDVEMLGGFVAISNDGNTIACGALQSDHVSENAGHAAVYHSCVAENLSLETNSFSIAPNPVTETDLLIVFKESISEGRIRLVDVSGKILLEENITSADQYKLTLSSVVSGTYQIIIETEGKVYREKLIKH